MDFLSQEAAKYGDLAQSYTQFGELFKRQLWHQLTVALEKFVLDEQCSRDTNFIRLYENFIKGFEAKVNQLKFVQIASVIAQQFCSKPSKPHEVEAAIAFMENIEKKREKTDDHPGLGDEAYVVAHMAVAELLIRHGSVQNRERAFEYMKDVKENLLPTLSGSGGENVANSAYYRVACEYYKVKGPADEFYKAAIQFLAYTPQDTLDKEHKESLAIDMSLAALVGETVYNFGEVLRQPILKVLDGTPHEWLHSSLQIFHKGDIAGYAELFKDNEAKIKNQPLLTHNLERLRQKIGLLCLMKLIFERPPEDRIIDLEEIAKATHLESEMIEWLLMRAMSKGLIKGKIDGVERVVQITWLKPRVLDPDQLVILDEKLMQWTNNVKNTLDFIEAETPELFQ